MFCSKDFEGSSKSAGRKRGKATARKVPPKTENCKPDKWGLIQFIIYVQPRHGTHFINEIYICFFNH